ncbi:23S rRNA (pseudouridine(1915)-N(3))-methyltransferase RlmH [Candidatus Saccharibacteria bacterium]|nr:23S rRNA (pseudouridine(1915)-N(3))-methyltransferase RlmH [Candidatus Saccharibacteria bacterium]MBQ6313464.1 23S rRNA (pseudouridine(1915)-N(3))-methyltransferase RlmH [Candidatus Saccharibacteria bacterium]
MIRIICGGKKNAGWVLEAISEYEKRLRKPFLVTWEFLEEEKFLKKLEEWPFSSSEFVICCDERGKNISSGEYSSMLSQAFLASRDVVILIGGAYGFSDFVRERADFVWGFSKLVFPHMIARLIVSEQTYRAQEIFNGGKYHHE